MEQHGVRHVDHELMLPRSVFPSPAVAVWCLCGHGGFQLGDVVHEDAAHAVGAEEQFALVDGSTGADGGLADAREGKREWCLGVDVCIGPSVPLKGFRRIWTCSCVGGRVGDWRGMVWVYGGVGGERAGVGVGVVGAGALGDGRELDGGGGGVEGEEVGGEMDEGTGAEVGGGWGGFGVCVEGCASGDGGWLWLGLGLGQG